MITISVERYQGLPIELRQLFDEWMASEPFLRDKRVEEMTVVPDLYMVKIREVFQVETSYVATNKLVPQACIDALIADGDVFED